MGMGRLAYVPVASRRLGVIVVHGRYVMSNRQFLPVRVVLILALLMMAVIPAVCQADDKVVTEYVMADFKDAEGWGIRSFAGSVGGSTFTKG